jgi:hypothetical protein
VAFDKLIHKLLQLRRGLSHRPCHLFFNAEHAFRAQVKVIESSSPELSPDVYGHRAGSRPAFTISSKSSSPRFLSTDRTITGFFPLRSSDLLRFCKLSE